MRKPVETTRQPRIVIEDLPVLETLSEEEAALIFGAGRFRPSFEVLEDRTLLSASPLRAGALIPPHPVKGQAISGAVVLHFSDAAPAARPSDYTAVICTGDGAILTSSANPQNVQVVANQQGGFDILLSYTYARQLTGGIFI